MLEQVTDVIILVAAVCVAITNIWRFFGKPFNFFKKKADIEKDKHANELAEQVTKSVMEKVEPLITEVKNINLDQSKRIQLLTNGQLDLLRHQILRMYEQHCQCQSLTKDEMEQLHKLYQDYVAEGGNSFVENLYKVMIGWPIKG